MSKNEYTIGNEDNLNKALDGLGQFCHNWCMNCNETSKNDLSFKCSECEFGNKDNSCAIKKFISEHNNGSCEKYTCMGNL